MSKNATATVVLSDVYARQQALASARADYSATWDEVYWSLEPAARAHVDLFDHPAIRDARNRIALLEVELAELRPLAGGKVYRIADAKLPTLQDRIARLNKRAKKLGCEPITLTVSDETEQVVRKVPDPHALAPEVAPEFIDEIIDFTYVTVDGPTPMVPGYVFVAILDHTVQDDKDDAVGIRRVPVSTFLRSQIGEKAAVAVEAADLDSYRHAENLCDHCRTKRRRNQTYLLFNVDERRMVQVGSDCLLDYTGAHNPEKIAAWAEYLAALDEDLMIEGEGGFGDVGVGGGRRAILTSLFLANVAAMMARDGWRPRWPRGDEYSDPGRDPYATADMALANMRAKKPLAEVADEHQAEADTALAWVRDELAESDDLDEFQHNLVTYTRGDFLPDKGDGFVAYTIMARRREIERKLNAERVADSEWIAGEGDRVKGLTFAVTFVRPFDDHYGVKFLTKGVTPDGNCILWWGSRELEQGRTYTGSATVKRHTNDSYNNDAKTTEITRLLKPVEVELVEGGDITVQDALEVTATHEQREKTRLRRLNPVALQEAIDSARSSINDYLEILGKDDRLSGSERRYYQDEALPRVERYCRKAEADLEAREALMQETLA